MINTIGTEPNDPLSYAPGSEHQHLNMSMVGGHGGQLDREIDIEISSESSSG